MHRIKKIGLWLLTGSAASLALLALLQFLLPYIINQAAILSKIEARISQEIKGEVDLERLNLSLWLYPHITLQEAHVKIPGKVTGTVETITLYPDLPALFRGKLRPAEVVLEAPDMQLPLPELEEFKGSPLALLTADQLAARLADALKKLQDQTPDFTVAVQNGTFKLLSGRAAFWFRNVDGHLTLGEIALQVECESNLWEKIHLQAKADPQGPKGQGHIALQNFRPHIITAFLFPDAELALNAGQVDLDLDFEIDGHHRTKASLKATWPSLTLARSGRQAILRDGHLKADALLQHDQTSITLNTLSLNAPQLKAQGKFLLPSPSRASQPITLKLSGSLGQVQALKEPARVLMGEKKILQRLFTFLQEGSVPEILFQAQGDTLRALDELPSMDIQGGLLNATVFIPKLAMTLRAVSGAFALHQGVLQGENLKGAYGDSRFHDGSLRLDLLVEENKPFYLNTALEADLKPLPALLKQIMKKPAHLEKIDEIKDLQGSAAGRLILEGRLKALHIQVKVADFKALARLHPVPFPLHLEGEGLFYEGKPIEKKIAVQRLNVRLKRSYFSELSGKIELNGSPTVAIRSGSASLSAQELYPWLSSLENLGPRLENIKGVEGLIRLSRIQLNGPLNRPKDWRFNLAGAVENFSVQAEPLPGALSIRRGKFTASPQRFSFAKADVKFLDAALNVSGALREPFKLTAVRLNLSGHMGPKATHWIGDLIPLPPDLSPRPPLSFSETHVEWDRAQREIYFTGVIGFQGDMEVSADFFSSPHRLAVKLSLQNQPSPALFQFTLKDRTIDLIFDGRLTKDTLDRLLEQNRFLNGWIEGQFWATLFRNELEKSQLIGEIEGKGISIPWPTAPLAVEHFAANARQQALTLKSARIAWRGNPINLNGNFAFASEQVVFDLNAAAGRLQWADFAGLLKQTPAGRAGKPTWLKTAWPLRGSLRVHIDQFIYDKYQFIPLRAEALLKDDQLTLTITETELCGISLSGTVKLTGQVIDAKLTHIAKDKNLPNTLSCLLDKKERIYGTYWLRSEISAQAQKPEALIKSTQGTFDFYAINGEVYGLSLFGQILTRVFAVLNVVQLFKGELPDLASEGFGYHSFAIKGEIQGEKILLNELTVDGESMRIIGRGTLNISDNSINLTLVISPLKTIDWFISRIPIIRYIFQGTLVSIPVRVRGSLKQPVVIPMEPGAVGSELLGIAQRILQAPLKLINPLIPGE